MKHPYVDICPRCKHGFEIHYGSGCALCYCKQPAPESVRILDMNNLPARTVFHDQPEKRDG